MLSLALITSLLFFLLPIAPISAFVTVSISRRHDPDARFPRRGAPMPKMCINHPPGVCCEVPPDPDFDNLYPKKRVEFHGLDQHDVAAVFSAEPPNTGCTGNSLANYMGAGSWEFEIPEGDDRNITGACYARLPAREPTDAEKLWLEGEGALAFFTEDSQWMSRRTNGKAALSMAAKWGLGGAAGGSSGFPFGTKRLGKRVVDMARMNMGGPTNEKRGIRSAKKGFIIFEGPKKTAWADTIEADGVLYTAKPPQSQVFVSADGRVLDYTKPAS
ncbi:MAG: hypothetical protein Q9170_003398 [Blastenia crenularia]